MRIKFITGNKNKYEEVREILDNVDLERIDIDLTEIQSLDAHEIIQHKLQEAFKQEKANMSDSEALIVEDTSMYLECLHNKLPGPFIKWFLEVLKPKGIAALVKNMGNTRAYCVTIIGFMDSKKQINFFEGRHEGTIVEPKGDKDFGWGPIFKPDGIDKTYGEMDRGEKYTVSMRGVAARSLKKFLVKKMQE